MSTPPLACLQCFRGLELYVVVVDVHDMLQDWFQGLVVLVTVDPVDDLSDVVITESTVPEQLAESIEEIIGQDLAALLETVIDDIVHVDLFNLGGSTPRRCAL